METFEKKQKQASFYFFSVLFILLIGSSFLYFNFKHVGQEEEWVNHTYQVISALNLTDSAMKDTESGIRGFMITDREIYLEPYQNGKIQAWSHFHEFQNLTLDNPVQIENAKTLDSLINQCIKATEKIYFGATNKAASSQSTLRTNSFLEASSCMNSLHSQIEVMKKEELKLLSLRNATTERNQYIFYLSLALTTLLSLLITSFAFFQIRKSQLQESIDTKLRLHENGIKDTIANIATLFSEDASLENSSDRLLSIICNQLNFTAAKLFLANDNHLFLSATFSATKESFTSNRNEAESGLLEQALKRKQVWYLNEIPHDFWKISSSLGEASPQTLVFVPLYFQDTILGIIELASFQHLSEKDVDFLTRISETTGVVLNAKIAKTKLQELLETTQMQSQELQAQSEELLSNNEELEQQTIELETQQEALQKRNADMEKFQRQLEQKASELQQTNQYKSEFLAKMSHELRTPLNGLLLLSTLLVENRERNLSDQQRQFAQSIYDAGNDLLTLINDILDLSKIEARKLALRPENFEVLSFMNHIYKNFEPQVSNKKLKFSVSVPESIEHLVLKTDRQRLEQILRNFISNAVKFTSEGGLTLKAEVFGDKHKTIKISVIDTGIGIPQNKQALIFEAFEQVDGSISRKYGGTGLGLTISRELAILLGGEIRVTSTEGTGSEFSVIIPVEMISEEEHQAPKRLTVAKTPTPEPEKISSEEVQNMLSGIPEKSRTILIVEDDERFRGSVAETVKSYQFHPIEAPSSEIALAILDRIIPDAILLDIKLPGISGLSLLETVKSMAHLRHIPIHMISALDYQSNALRMGALGYLTKPVSMEKIRSAMDRIENIISNHLRRVLLIEDDPRQSDAIKQLVSGPDVEIHPVRSGKEAIAALAKGSFDCIILDLSLPDVSGADLLTQFNSMDISLPPIVIYTGKELTHSEEDYLRKFSESIIIKGARSPERLLDEVNLFLHRVESMIPTNQREMMDQLRSQENSFEGKHVLIVDDDVRNIFALTSVLESKKINVHVAKNGLEALDLLHETKGIHLVLMDIMMPKMDGYETMKAIRGDADETLRKIPIIALTAKAMKDDFEKCIQAGANDYLPKPVKIDNLVSVMKVWLSPKGPYS